SMSTERPSCHYFHLFFHSHRPSRYLHSFPTRRSSDLFEKSIRTATLHPCPARLVPPPRVMTGAPCSRQTATVSITSSRLRGTTTDRKSTRLNSSHSQISYAVFCLKKKKKTNKKYHTQP